MANTTPKNENRLDAFGRRHPGLMWAAVVLLAVAVTVLLIVTDQAPVVLYRAF